MTRKILATAFIIALALALGIGLLSMAQDQADDAGEAPFLITQSRQVAIPSPADAIWQMLGQVKRDRAVNDLRRLTGEEPICTSSGCYTAANRLTGSEGLHWAMDYIYENLVSLGYSVEFRDWSRSGLAGRNLIARKVGMFAPTEEVYLIAHVDGVQRGVEERFPAADDNASGAVDMLETARILNTYSFSRTLVLLFSTGEEQSASGVKSYLDQLSAEELSRIRYAVNVDMVGYDENRDGVMELWHGDHQPSWALTQVMSETIGTYQLDLTPRILVGCG
jgi:acetylornithine deacetylase/succinyl-diaminopimelate desuccinylase-like protein